MNIKIFQKIVLCAFSFAGVFASSSAFAFTGNLDYSQYFSQNQGYFAGTSGSGGWLYQLSIGWDYRYGYPNQTYNIVSSFSEPGGYISAPLTMSLSGETAPTVFNRVIDLGATTSLYGFYQIGTYGYGYNVGGFFGNGSAGYQIGDKLRIGGDYYCFFIAKKDYYTADTTRPLGFIHKPAIGNYGNEPCPISPGAGDGPIFATPNTGVTLSYNGYTCKKETYADPSNVSWYNFAGEPYSSVAYFEGTGTGWITTDGAGNVSKARFSRYDDGSQFPLSSIQYPGIGANTLYTNVIDGELSAFYFRKSQGGSDAKFNIAQFYNVGGSLLSTGNWGNYYGRDYPTIKPVYSSGAIATVGLKGGILETVGAVQTTTSFNGFRMGIAQTVEKTACQFANGNSCEWRYEGANLKCGGILGQYGQEIGKCALDNGICVPIKDASGAVLTPNQYPGQVYTLSQTGAVVYDEGVRALVDKNGNSIGNVDSQADSIFSCAETQKENPSWYSYAFKCIFEVAKNAMKVPGSSITSEVSDFGGNNTVGNKSISGAFTLDLSNTGATSFLGGTGSTNNPIVLNFKAKVLDRVGNDDSVLGNKYFKFLTAVFYFVLAISCIVSIIVIIRRRRRTF